MEEFEKRYSEIWEVFTNQISTLSNDLIMAANTDSEGNLHAMLTSLQGVPYYKAPQLFDGLNLFNGLNLSDKRSNIGSVTGVFFELIVASLVTGFIKRNLPEASITLNSCDTEGHILRTISRDPDIFVRYLNRYVIFEVKVSPKQNELKNAIKLREEYLRHSSEKAEYLLVGGHVSANWNLLKSVQGWSCFTSSSDRNRGVLDSYKLDDILKKALDFLTSTE